jgi:septum formation protein
VEAGRLDADAGRADADAGRLEADAARADADAGRADAEAARTGADAARAEADAGRAEADAGRAPAEAARAGAGAVLIVAADTTVALGDVIYGKPLDGEDARRMLRELRGRPHQVFSAVSVLRVPGERQATRINTTEVTMRDYGDDEIEAYVASGDPLDKAGAYGIQASEFNCAAHLQGCYAGVMGLPLADLTALLGEFGYAVPRDVQAVCKLFNPFGCCAAAPAHAVAITLG